jgi:hypothetical protein
MRQRYSDTDKDSGVHSFEIADTSITVWFKGTDRSYTYSYHTAGQHHIEQMKRLAQRGDGLNEYINDHVRKSYD